MTAASRKRKPKSATWRCASGAATASGNIARGTGHERTRHRTALPVKHWSRDMADGTASRPMHGVSTTPGRRLAGRAAARDRGRATPRRHRAQGAARGQAAKARRAVSVRDARLRRLARQVHGLGERPLFELFRELDDGAELWDALERYARVEPLARLHAPRWWPGLRSAGASPQRSMTNDRSRSHRSSPHQGRNICGAHPSSTRTGRGATRCSRPL